MFGDPLEDSYGVYKDLTRAVDKIDALSSAADSTDGMVNVSISELSSLRLLVNGSRAWINHVADGQFSEELETEQYGTVQKCSYCQRNDADHPDEMGINICNPCEKELED